MNSPSKSRLPASSPAPSPAQGQPARARRDAGFTLIELLVVLVILGLLAGLIGPQVMSYLGSSKTKAARLQIEQIAASLDLYRLDVGSYPTSQQGLKALIVAPAGVKSWSGPYLSKGVVPDDPWGNPYLYRIPGKNRPFDLYSLGRDAREGGDGEDQDVSY